MIQMLKDDQWRLPRKDSARVLNALAYFAEPEDLIPDHIPGVGLLDDAIMIKFVEEDLEHELWGYRKFKAFREGSEQRFWTDTAKARLAPRLEPPQGVEDLAPGDGQPLPGCQVAEHDAPTHQQLLGHGLGELVGVEVVRRLGEGAGLFGDAPPVAGVAAVDVGEVGHAVSDLARHLQHGAHRRRLARVALLTMTKTNT